ncbi:MAG: GNAT family N-acetyltransferase [Deltaproteobacteria bacterium]|jgi:ribosomal-protein-alanine N-acetyltransferase|nr:GNAT family N-acetyltransferase [Deltaproteobacteria bacterium]
MLHSLTTPRFVIRRFVQDDHLAVAELMGDPPTPQAQQERRSWLDWTVQNYQALEALKQPPYGDYAIVEKGGVRPIGAVGLVPSYGPFAQLAGPEFGGAQGLAPCSPEIGLYYEVHPDWRRRGVAAEAASALISFARSELKLGRIVATTTHDNAGSIGVMRRLGMQILRNPHPEPFWFQTVGVLRLVEVP